MTLCKICSTNFETDKAFHAHLKKHNLYQADYYCSQYPRYSVFYKQKIPFINKKQYFSQEFIDYNEFLQWEKTSNQQIVKTKCLEMLKSRIDEKKYVYAPFHNEIKTLELPPISFYKKYFQSYNAACNLIGKQPIFNKACPNEFFQDLPLKNFTVLVDTREQDSLPFDNQEIEKLFVGDYLIKEVEYNYTFVDRKSENDFLGTLSSGVERFEKEIQRAVELEGYLFVVVESSIEDIIINHKKFKRKTNLEYVFHNMRHLTHKYARKLQFIFTGNREKSLEIIPKLLFYGKSLWQVDIQYFLQYGVGNRRTKA